MEKILNSSKNILLVCPFVSLKGEIYFNRFRYLALNLTKIGYNVTLVTSDFEHFSKSFRGDATTYNEGYEIVLIKETGYNKNVELKRIYSHYNFCKNLDKYLESLQYKPDLIYSAYPLICSNLILGKYKDKNKIPLIIDVQDIWPDSIASYFGKFTKILQPLVNLFSIRASEAYSYADGIIAVSDTYLNLAKKDLNIKYNQVVYLGADVSKVNAIEFINKEEGTFVVTYIGTLSYSYDIETIIKAAYFIKNKFPLIKFVIIGDGPLKDKFLKINIDHGSPVVFLGVMPYEKMIGHLKASDIGLNAITKEALQSITNKLSDYVCTRTPILNSSENHEIKELISNNNIGLNYTAGNHQSLINAIVQLYKEKNKLVAMKKNTLKVVQRFNRDEEYMKIYKMIKELIDES
jgi:glycosyltransferase involved in cell wall biosynthesis